MTDETQPQYPAGAEEIGHDAYAIARVTAAQMRMKGTDPTTISAADAWNRYIEKWEEAAKRTGEQKNSAWAEFVKQDSPLAQAFMIAWNHLNRAPTALERILRPPEMGALDLLPNLSRLQDKAK